MDRYDYMREALALAKEGMSAGEIPVGCVIVKDNKILSKARNFTVELNSPVKHAEIVAIENACETLGCSNLSGCDLYVTLEPCPMCTGAIINAKINKVVFGAFDINYGACGSALNLFSLKNVHSPEYYGGIMEDECSSILSEFFKKLRNK